jgi:NAD(P)H-nitrite reductase large subunit
MRKGSRFVIVGNGIAGITAAHVIRRINKEAEISIVSEEPHPTYSACMLPHYLSGDISRERVFVREFPDYLRERVRLIASEKAIHLDMERKRVSLETEAVVFDKLIVATGSIPAIPDIRGTDKKGVFTFKSLRDADGVCGWRGCTAVVIGSGLVGVEVALALKRKGYRVFLMEYLDRILPQIFDEYPASLIRSTLSDSGIDVSTKERVVEILGKDKVEGVASTWRRIPCDTVILAAGMKPEKGLVQGVVDVGDSGGIRVNDRMCTSIEDVYACGDCVEAQSLIDGRPILSLLWHNARQQGQVAGSNAVGVPKRYAGSLPVSGVEVLGLRAVSIGHIATSLGSDLEVIEREKAGRYCRLILSRGVLVGVQSINWDENLGSFLAAILRKEKVKKRGESIFSRYPYQISLRQVPFGRRLVLNGLQTSSGATE